MYSKLMTRFPGVTMV